MSQIFFFLVSIIFIIEGLVYLVKGRGRRRLSSNQEIIYEGALIRVLSFFILVLGIVSGLGAMKIISESTTLNLWLLIVIPSAILGFIVERNGIVSEK